MFRLSRTLRAHTPFTTAFVPTFKRASSQIVRNGQTYQSQPVRFVSGGISLRRLVSWGLYTSAVSAYIYYIFPGVHIEELDENEQHAEGQVVEDGEDDWADENSRFIPLTWSKKLPREYYKGSDPEWQEFRKIAKDRPRQQKAYKELISVIATGVVQHPGIARQLGKNPEIGKYLLDLTFPDGPPQEYSRKGIEIGDGFIAISEQRISAEQQNRNTRLLWPTHVLGGIYAGCRTMWGFQYKKMKQALGIESKTDPGSPEHRAEHLLGLLQAREASKQGRSLSGTPSNPGAGPDTTADASKATDLQASKASTDPKAPGDSERRWYMPSVKPGIPGEPMEQMIAISLFAHALQKGGQGQQRSEPPRGTFLISGLVQMKGSRAAITFDVQAFYDPKISRFTTVNVAPRTLKRWTQQPRGGN